MSVAALLLALADAAWLAALSVAVLRWRPAAAAHRGKFRDGGER